MAPVLLLNPACIFLRMFPACPLPKTGEDGAIYFAKGAATDNVPVIVGPSPYFGVEDKNQVGGCFGAPFPYGFSDVLQEELNILLRRLNEQFAARVSAHVLSEKIEARGHVRDDGLIWGEF